MARQALCGHYGSAAFRGGGKYGSAAPMGGGKYGNAAPMGGGKYGNAAPMGGGERRTLSRGISITRQELHVLVWEEPLAVVAVRFGLSANGIAKVCDRMGIPRPPRGHWTRPASGRVAQRPLPATPLGADDRILLGGPRQSARRPRSRMPLAARRNQLLDEAARVAMTDGVQDVTLKRLARQVGISEAQAHNCFPGRLDLLLALARREIGIVESRRLSAVARGTDRIAMIAISTISYLHEAQARGPLLQILLHTPEIRQALRAERAEAAAIAREPILRFLSNRFAMDRRIANASTAALTAVCLRAGGLIASGRTDLATAERLCLAVVLAGARSNEAHGRTDQPPGPGQ